VRAGYSTRQAIMAQLFTAIAAFAGTATAVAVSSESWMEDRLLWITAGGFVYLAATTILPEVLNDEGHLHNGRRSSRMVYRLAQLLAFSSGIIFMSLVDWLSDDDDHHHHTHAHSHIHDSRQDLHDHSEL
jgi:zinc transporter ZupT